MEKMTIIECPRDAMQGLQWLIPASEKVAYLRSLLKVGFSILDCGSFVSPNAIPQMKDTGFVLDQIMAEKGETQLSVIIGNERGAYEALSHPAVDIIGYPWSISPSFLKYNIRSEQEKSWLMVLRLAEMTHDSGKRLNIYISMAFGNPYGDDWSAEMLKDAVSRLIEAGISNITLSDTVGKAIPEDLFDVFSSLNSQFPSANLGAHLHTSPDMLRSRLAATWQGGCRQFDSALNGLGGCPLSGYELVGNMNTLEIIQFCIENNFHHGLDLSLLLESQLLATQTFQRH